MSGKFTIGELVRFEGRGQVGMVDYIFEDRVFVKFQNLSKREYVMEYTINELEPVTEKAPPDTELIA